MRPRTHRIPTSRRGSASSTPRAARRTCSRGSSALATATSAESPTAITPGEVHEYLIELGPIGVRFPAGARIRLQVGSSDFPQWDRNLNTGGPFGTEGATAGRMALQIVLHNDAYPSRLTLPVVE